MITFKQAVLTFYLLLSPTISSAQNYIYVGDKQYASTSTWEFQSSADYGNNDGLEVSVARQPNGGYLLLGKSTGIKGVYISGTVTLFLEDGSMIKCMDRGVRDYVDNKSIALYAFTEAEMEKLQTHRIAKIRYALKCYRVYTMECDQSYTADNKKPYSYGEDNYYATSTEIENL